MLNSIINDKNINDKNINDNVINVINLSKIFDSIDMKHQIEIKIIDDISWFNIIKIDYEKCKTFLILLKSVIEYLNLNNVKFIKQYIYEEDLKFFEKSSFLDINNNQYIISTDIRDFLLELVNALGVNKL